jgi:hypothetical protein
VVTVKDADDKPLPRVPIRLGVLHSSVPRGDTNEDVAREGDETGSARFDGLSFGTGHSYRVSASRAGGTYVHPPFGLGPKAGKRATIHAYEATSRLDSSMIVVMGSAVFFALKEDAIQVQQLIQVLNMGRVAWLADMPVQLPQGFKAFTKQDSADDARIEELPDTGAVIRGTFPPGQRDLLFNYQVPLTGVEAQSLAIHLPQRTTQAQVIAEAAKTMTLAVKGFPEAKQETRSGKRLLRTEKAARSPGEVSNLEITFSGLPTHGMGRWIAVALAVLAFAAGAFYFIETSGGLPDEDARRDLNEAREALLDEIVALERAHKAGEIGPKTYARVRASLLDALAHIVGMIEAPEPKKKSPAKRPARRAEVST